MCLVFCSETSEGNLFLPNIVYCFFFSLIANLGLVFYYFICTVYSTVLTEPSAAPQTVLWRGPPEPTKIRSLVPGIETLTTKPYCLKNLLSYINI